MGIWLWPECVCLCIWNISLLLLTCFCFWILELITQVLDVLVVSLCKPVIHKLKILVGGIGSDQILNVSGGKQKGGVGGGAGGTIFDSNLVEGKSWRKLWQGPCYNHWAYFTIIFLVTDEQTFFNNYTVNWDLFDHQRIKKCISINYSPVNYSS